MRGRRAPGGFEPHALRRAAARKQSRLPLSGNTTSMPPAALVAALIVTSLLGVVLFGLWALEAIVRGGGCGPAEGGGSCDAGLLSWALLGGTLVAFGATIVLLVGLVRRR